MRRALFVSALGVLGACSGDDGPSGAADASTDGATADASTVDAAIDAPPSTAFTLTSPTITEGGAIPLTHVCTNLGGMNLSPQLAWTNAPVGTLSFAVVLTDKSNNLIHSAIYDIPSALTMLPPDVDKMYSPPDVLGAHQTASYQAGVRGYNGPCPSTAHMYEHRIYAIATATVPGTSITTTRSQLVAILGANNLGTTTLTATFTPP